MSEESSTDPSFLDGLPSLIEAFANNGWWDGTNTVVALIAVLISLGAASKSFKLSEFDDEYGSRILDGCNDIRKFIDEISIVVNEFDQQKRQEASVSLMENLNRYTNPLFNAAMYFDQNHPKQKAADTLSGNVTQIIDDLSEALDILSGNTSRAVNWKITFDGKITSVNASLSKIHTHVSKLKKSL